MSYLPRKGAVSYLNSKIENKVKSSPVSGIYLKMLFLIVVVVGIVLLIVIGCNSAVKFSKNAPIDPIDLNEFTCSMAKGYCDDAQQKMGSIDKLYYSNPQQYSLDSSRIFNDLKNETTFLYAHEDSLYRASKE